MLRPPKKNPKESSFGHGDGSERHPYHGAARMLGTPARFVAFFHPDYTVGSGISPDLLTRMRCMRRSRARPRIETIPPVGNHTLP